MIKKTITFEDFEGNKHTESYYFHLSKAELVEMEFSKDEGGMKDYLERIVAAKDIRGVIAEFKEVIKASYGVRSADGKRFSKTPENLAAFMDTNAYSELFMELAGDEDKAAEFFNGVVPQDSKYGTPAAPQDHLSKQAPTAQIVAEPEEQSVSRHQFENTTVHFPSSCFVENLPDGRVSIKQGSRSLELTQEQLQELDQAKLNNLLAIYNFML